MRQYEISYEETRRGLSTSGSPTWRWNSEQWLAWVRGSRNKTYWDGDAIVQLTRERHPDVLAEVVAYILAEKMGI